MENASKAVIMAGSVLIAVVVISLALYVYTTYRDQAASDAQLFSISQITSFNRFYESYGDRIRGVDVINIYNKVADDSVDDYEITIEPATIGGLDSNLTGSDQTKHYLDLYDYKINYDSNGRISKIEISK